MNDTAMTIVGNVVAPPRMRMTRSGHAVTNFRVASTSRRYDNEHGRFVDRSTLFMTVTCWRGLAENVALSVHKGQPVVVTGRVFCREYEVGETKRVAYELEANAVGHDLTRGLADFRKSVHPSAALSLEVDAEGLPADDSDRWLDLADQPADQPADQVGEPGAVEERELVSVG